MRNRIQGKTLEVSKTVSPALRFLKDTSAAPVGGSIFHAVNDSLLHLVIDLILPFESGFPGSVFEGEGGVLVLVCSTS